MGAMIAAAFFAVLCFTGTVLAEVFEATARGQSVGSHFLAGGAIFLIGGGMTAVCVWGATE